MVCEAFAAVLSVRRAEFNAWAAQARRTYPGFDQQALGRFLTEFADPVVNSVAAVAPECASDVASTAMRMGLDLVGERMFDAGARAEALAQAWTGVAPGYAALVARHPAQVLGLLSNAMLHLAALPGVNTARWAREMRTLAAQVTSVAQLRALGQVLAWRAGAAHYRVGAIAAADSLPEALALMALRVTDGSSWRQARAALLHDPWWHAASDPDAASARKIGAFAGFGGAFAAPPLVRVAHGDHPCFVVRSGESGFWLHADAHGAVLLPARANDFDTAVEAPGAGSYAVRDGQLVVGPQAVTLDMPAEKLALCMTATTLAVSSPYSHAIVLVARQ